MVSSFFTWKRVFTSFSTLPSQCLDRSNWLGLPRRPTVIRFYSKRTLQVFYSKYFHKLTNQLCNDMPCAALLPNLENLCWWHLVTVYLVSLHYHLLHFLSPCSLISISSLLLLSPLPNTPSNLSPTPLNTKLLPRLPLALSLSSLHPSTMSLSFLVTPISGSSPDLPRSPSSHCHLHLHLLVSLSPCFSLSCFSFIFDPL